MKVSDLKKFLTTNDSLTIQLPGKETVAQHFHITEVGVVTKRFMDCGNTFRTTQNLHIQLWVADDIAHRLVPEKAIIILEESTNNLGAEDLSIIIEHQVNGTINLFSLAEKDNFLQLVPIETQCLAIDTCNSETKQDASYCCSSSTNCC